MPHLLMTRCVSTPASFITSSSRTPKIVPVAPVIPTIIFMGVPSNSEQRPVKGNQQQQQHRFDGVQPQTDAKKGFAPEIPLRITHEHHGGRIRTYCSSR